MTVCVIAAEISFPDHEAAIVTISAPVKLKSPEMLDLYLNHGAELILLISNICTTEDSCST